MRRAVEIHFAAVLLLLSCTAALQIPTRAMVRMSAADDAAAAKRRWLEQSANDPRFGGNTAHPAQSAEEEMAQRQREKTEARKRTLDAMGQGGADVFRQGGAVAFGLGVDDEDYGYGPSASTFGTVDHLPGVYSRERDDDAEDPLPAWVSRELPSGGIGRQKDDDPWKSSKSGFDGRADGWARKADLVDPNPPPMQDTLRAPRPGSLPVNDLFYGLATGSTDFATRDDAPPPAAAPAPPKKQRKMTAEEAFAAAEAKLLEELMGGGDEGAF